MVEWHSGTQYTDAQQLQEEQQNLCDSDYVDATCFSSFSKTLPYVPTVSNVINKSIDGHLVPAELTEEGNSANMMTDDRLLGQI